jgi:hypothetical protein
VTYDDVTGRAYLVYADAVAENSKDIDIYLKYSDNDGATWSAPVRVNDDAPTTSQFLPQAAIDPTTGDLAITWYDAREDTADNKLVRLYGTVRGRRRVGGRLRFGQWVGRRLRSRGRVGGPVLRPAGHGRRGKTRSEC